MPKIILIILLLLLVGVAIPVSQRIILKQEGMTLEEILKEKLSPIKEEKEEKLEKLEMPEQILPEKKVFQPEEFQKFIEGIFDKLNRYVELFSF